MDKQTLVTLGKLPALRIVRFKGYVGIGAVRNRTHPLLAQPWER